MVRFPDVYDGMQIFVHDMVVNIFAAIYLYFECMLIGAIIANGVAAYAVLTVAAHR